jgi:hypothetical protein
MSKNSFIAPINLSDTLIIDRAPNGGYVVTAENRNEKKTGLVGAFGSVDEMLDALCSSLRGFAA